MKVPKAWISVARRKKPITPRKAKEVTIADLKTTGDEKADCREFIRQVKDGIKKGLTRHLHDLDYTHIANEREGERQKQYEYMGVLKGRPDYLTLWATREDHLKYGPFYCRRLWIEAKVYRGSKSISALTIADREALLDDDQLKFRRYCFDKGIPHEITLSTSEMIDTYFKYGVFK